MTLCRFDSGLAIILLTFTAKGIDIKTITRQQLQEQLERQDDIKYISKRVLDDVVYNFYQVIPVDNSNSALLISESEQFVVSDWFEIAAINLARGAYK